FPHNPEWSYRLNDLVANALRRSGALATFQALRRVGQLNFLREPFIYLTPQNVYKPGEKKPFTDLDLVCLSEGHFLIGEVKSKAGGFYPADIERLGEVATAILPDRLVFAAPGTDWRPEVDVQIEATKSALAPLGVSVERLVLES